MLGLKFDCNIVEIRFIVLVKPRIKSELEDDDVRNGTSYQLNCSATGDPDPTYKWTRNGKPNVPNSATTLNSSLLKIDPVTIENEGIYTCTVQNIQGNASSTAKITVYGKLTLFH